MKETKDNINQTNIISHPNEKIMREIIKDQWTENSIYAAIVAPDGRIVSKGRTTVNEDHDPTAHAEINAMRSACAALGLSTLPAGYWLYSTFEPCPLCAAAAIWAGIDGIVYANNPDYRGHEVNWSFVKCRDMLKAGEYLHEVSLTEDFLIDEIKDYFQ